MPQNYEDYLKHTRKRGVFSITNYIVTFGKTKKGVHPLMHPNEHTVVFY